MSDGYPVMLNLTGKTCVAIGGGAVAARKIDSLLDAGAIFVVVSSEITAAIRAYNAVLLAARALIRTQYPDVSTDPDEVVREFRTRFYDTKLSF